MSMKLFEMKQELRQAISKKETLLEDARAAGGRSMTDSERADYQAAFSKELELKAQINEREAMSTIRQFDPVALMDGSAVRKGAAEHDEGNALKNVTLDHPKASALKNRFGAWMRRGVGSLTGMEMPGTGTDAEYQQSGAMEASSPSGIISVGSGTGLDSVGFAVPTQILPFMKSYFAFSPFEKAGSPT